MTAKQAIRNLRGMGAESPAQYFLYLANHAHDARLLDGQRLCDATDFIVFLRELAEASSTVIEIGPAQGVALGLRARIATCHRCGHVHELDGECGVYMGKSAGYCRCELEASA
jgi:hypothetical protein